MNEGVNIYVLMRGFWRENDYEPFSTAEIALFFLLVDKANCRRWRMPFKCPTAVVCRSIKVTKQTVMTARENLCKRGIVFFTKGKGNGNTPEYTLVPDPRNWTAGLTVGLTDGLTDDLTDDLTDSLTVSETKDLTIGLTPYNIKDINIKDKIYSNNGEGQILNLDELEKMLLADTKWHEQIQVRLSEQYKTDACQIKKQIAAFFQQLRCQGIDSKEEKECRTHFFNWIKKQLKKTYDGNNRQQEPDRRGVSDVTTDTERDYGGAF